MKKTIKWTITIILTVLAQYAVIWENGHWGIGGNVFVPLLCYLVLFKVPKVFKDVRK